MAIEKVLVVIVQFKANRGGWSADDLLYEMTELVNSCRGTVVHHVVCRLDQANAGTLIGEGKVQEIAQLCEEQEADTVVFNLDLKGSQQRNLEEAFHRKTIDRTQLILDIFARRAKSLEGKMQVELAQLEYLLPRLVGHGVEMSRMGGGIGTMGPGETKLEMDRRRIHERISRLKQDLAGVSENRSLKRKKRQEEGIPLVSLVGYTNAGKSTLLNALTQSEQVAHNGLFTTLDPLSRQLILPNHQKVVISDTVGFIHDLPHHLVESFKATLEEATSADLLLHVLDVSHAKFHQLYDSVIEVLTELKAVQKPMITVLNKIDNLADRQPLPAIAATFPQAVLISAKTTENLDELLAKISEALSYLLVRMELTFPLSRMDLVNLAHQEGQVHSVSYDHQAIRMVVSLPPRVSGLFKPFETAE